MPAPYLNRMSLKKTTRAGLLGAAAMERSGACKTPSFEETLAHLRQLGLEQSSVAGLLSGVQSELDNRSTDHLDTGPCLREAQPQLVVHAVVRRLRRRGRQLGSTALS